MEIKIGPFELLETMYFAFANYEFLMNIFPKRWYRRQSCEIKIDVADCETHMARFKLRALVRDKREFSMNKLLNVLQSRHNCSIFRESRMCEGSNVP